MNNTSTIIHAALDVSGPEASFALAVEGRDAPVFSLFRPMRGRTASTLPDWLAAVLGEHGYELQQINRWTVGSGPGSFTGLRMAASLIAGLTFAREGIVTRCLPTALGMAAGLDAADGTSTACLFDGRNRELLLYGVQHRNGSVAPSGESAVIDAGNAAAILENYTALTAFTRDQTAISELLPPEFAAKVNYREHLPIDAMLRIPSDNWNNDLTELVYIRQAVFTPPSC